MIINHVFIGRGPAKASDLFNVLTWASIGATVNIYVAHPDKRRDEQQHDYASLFNLKQDLGNGATLEHRFDPLFATYRLVDNVASGLADRVKLVNLRQALAAHADLVPEGLMMPTLGWKTGILKFLDSARDWWPNTERVFTAVDATKFYLAATRQGLTCDMKVGPTVFFWDYEKIIAEKFVSFQRGGQSATGYENQMSGSMCALTAEPRKTYAAAGERYGTAFGSKSVETASRSFEQITSEHGKAMQRLESRKLGVDSTKLGGRAVLDPESGWKGPFCVYKHPKDQSWKEQRVEGMARERAKSDIDKMTASALDTVRTKGTLGGEVYEAMVEISKFPGFNIYA